MSILKVKNNGVWQHVGAPFIGDVDTLDGKHADEFALASDVAILQAQIGDSSVSEQISAALEEFSSTTTSGGSITVDSEFSNISENPVQNKVVTQEFKEVKDRLSTIPVFETREELFNQTITTESGQSAAVFEDFNLNLQDGEVYYITINGTTYQGTAAVTSDAAALSNGLSSDDKDFVGIQIAFDGPTGVIYFSASGTYDLIVSKPTYHKLDSKYLPDCSRVSVSSSNLTDFIQNTDVDYAYDNTTGANYTIVRIYKNKIDGTKQYPFVYAPNGANSGTMTTYDLAVAEGWLFAVNAGVFDTSNTKPDGIVVQNGVVVQNSQTVTHSQCKHLTIDSNGNLGYAEYDADANDLVANGIVSVVTGFIPIIVDYQDVPSSEWNSVAHYTENAQRQIIGQFGNGDYAIITCEGRSFDNSDGWTIAEAQSICKKHGLKFAYNLDGGGSTETMLGLKHINTIYEGATGRKVPTFIVFNGTSVFDGNEPEEPEFVIPSEYTEVEYIQTDGSQYINSGIPETEIYSVEYKALNEYLHGQRGHILSSTNTYVPFTKRFDGNTHMSIITKNKGVDKAIESDTNFSADTTQPYIIKAVYNGTNVSVYANSIFKYTAEVGNTADVNNKYYFFAYGGNTSAENYRFTGKLYYMKMHDVSGNLVHYYVPVKNSSGIYGLYDAVTGEFYDSDSTTTFNGA